MSESRMRLTILGGYLGSGKTTWLRHQIHEGVFDNALVIVNEAAETPVDDALLQKAAELRVLPGGCCCCDGKDALLQLLRDICDQRSKTASTSERLQRIILETSGLADPAPIVDAIRHDRILENHIVVNEVIVIVDSMHAFTQLTSEPLSRRQLEIADRIILSKIDEAIPAEIAALARTLASLNQGAVLSGAIKGNETALNDWSSAPVRALPDIDAADAKPAPTPARIYLGDTIDWTAFSIWLSALLHVRGNDVVRVKGVVRTPAGRLLVQAVRRIVQSPEILPEQNAEHSREDNMIVVIGRGYRPDDLNRSLHVFAGVKE